MARKSKQAKQSASAAPTQGVAAPQQQDMMDDMPEPTAAGVETEDGEMAQHSLEDQDSISEAKRNSPGIIAPDSGPKKRRKSKKKGSKGRLISVTISPKVKAACGRVVAFIYPHGVFLVLYAAVFGGVVAGLTGYADAGGPDGTAALTIVGLLGFCVGVAYMAALWKMAAEPI